MCFQTPLWVVLNISVWNGRYGDVGKLSILSKPMSEQRMNSGLHRYFGVGMFDYAVYGIS